MNKVLRIGALMMLASLLAFTVKPASAQMMHYNLDVLVVLTSDQLLTGGTVCVSGEVDNICQDIAPGTGSGEIYSFTGLGGGDHTVTVSGNPYLEAVDYVTLENVDTQITISLEMEQLPGLPNTGSGAVAGNTSVNLLFGATAVLALTGAAVAARRGRFAGR